MARPDPVAQCRFFSADDALRIALQAYYAAARHLEPPPGESFYDEDGAPWCSAEDFADQFSAEVQARVGLLALDHLGTFYVPTDSFDVRKLAAMSHPEKMAPIIAEWERVNTDEDSIFLAHKLNHLPL